MLLRLKKFQSFYRLRSQVYLNNGNNLSCNSFCTINESLQVDELVQTESPELPDWVKSNIMYRDDEDFVLPSLSRWIENHDKRFDLGNVDVVESDVDKISKILKNRFESPDAVVEALSGVSVDVTESLVEQILERFCFDWIQAVGAFKWANSQKGFNFSPNLYNSMVNSLGKARKFDLMWEFVEQMKQLQGYITFFTMGGVIRRLAKAGKYGDAVEVFRNFEQYGLIKDIRGLNLLMGVLVSERCVELAEGVYLEFKDDFAPDQSTFNILVHGWCKARKMEEATKTINEMKKNGFSPDAVTYTCFIEAYCYEKDFRKVDGTLVDMRRKGLSPTVVTYTIIIKALGKAKEINKALDVYEKMKQDGCVPDNSLYSTLILNLSNCGRLKDAQELFEDMGKLGLVPDVMTYNAMITAAVQHLKEEHALVLLKRMEENQCKPDLKTYAPLLKMCCILKRMKVLSFLLRHMFKNNVSLDLGMYSLLVSRLSVNGSPERACSFFEEAIKRGFVPTNDMYTKLVKNLKRRASIKKKAGLMN